MTLKIKRIAGKHKTRICLSGQLRSENVGQVKAEVGHGGARVALDLGEVDLVDIDASVFSTCVSRQGSRSCTVRHTSGNGCCRREAKRKAIRKGCKGAYLVRTTSAYKS